MRAKIQEWASGWNSPSLPGEVYKDRDKLKTALRKKMASNPFDPESVMQEQQNYLQIQDDQAQPISVDGRNYSHGNNFFAEDMGSGSNGWQIDGDFAGDEIDGHYVQNFEATHPQHGRVWGDLNGEVFGTSIEAIKDFFATNPPTRNWAGDVENF